jgi:hypothetical protein
MKKKRRVTRFGGELPEPDDIVQLTLTIPGPATERRKHIIAEWFAQNFGASFSFAPGFDQNYQKAYYEALRRSESKRRAFELVRIWDHRLAIAREDGQPIRITSDDLLTLFAPIFDALEKRDAEFFKGFAQAVLIIEQRENSSKTKYPSSLDKWLLEYGLANGWTATHTVRELNEQFVSKSRAITDDKLRERCKRLSVPLKPDVRGQGAVRRRKKS